jgi:hypothetical protein
MTEQRVEGVIAAPVEKVWAILREFGDLRWGNIQGTVLEGEGVGCVRVFTATGGLVVRERLESLDDAAHSLSYTLLDSPELPWTDYLAHIRLTEVDGHTHLDWHARFEPRNVAPEQAQGIVRAIFENGIHNLKRTTGG